MAGKFETRNYILTDNPKPFFGQKGDWYGGENNVCVFFTNQRNYKVILGQLSMLAII